MNQHTSTHPAMPRFHRWIRRWFDFSINLEGIDIAASDIDRDLATGRD
jgi:hypothetical protein